VDADQHVLALPEKDELVITTRNGEWYIRGSLGGRVLPAKLFIELGDAVHHAEKYLRKWAFQTIAEVKKEDHWASDLATPIQVRLLRSFGYDIPSWISENKANEIIKQDMHHSQ